MPTNHPPGPWKDGDPIEIRAIVNGQTGAPYRIAYRPPPRIIAVIPPEASENTALVINGSGFGDDQGSSVITVAGTPVAPDTKGWSASRIGFHLPASPPPGPWQDRDAIEIRVTINGQPSTPFIIKYTKP